VISPSKRPLPTQDNTAETQRNFHDPSGIRTRDHSNQAVKTYALHRAATGAGNVRLTFSALQYYISFSFLFYNYI
jgi:hypothetical protein